MLGGTMYTLAYAMKKGLETLLIDLNEQKQKQ
jgi:hypothetical protein